MRANIALNFRFSKTLLAAALLLPALLRADGPHWQIPNPWTEYEMDSGRPRPPKVPKYAEDAKAKSKVNLANEPFVNPGAVSFAEMDEKSIKYYEEHCAFKYPGNKSEFYIMIMLRAAQAMREVDTYCPCPDSYPLWHSEEGREFMLWAAAQTWKASTTLNPKDAQACAKVIVKAYVDSVRYKEDAEVIAQLKVFIDANKRIEDVLSKASGITDQDKLRKIFSEWHRARDGITGGDMRAVANTLDSFRFLTGDIPAINLDTQTRMAQAIIGMGPGVLPALAEALKETKNAAVHRALKMAGETITNNIRRPPPPARKAEPQKKPAEPAKKEEAQKPVEQKPAASEPAKKPVVEEE